MVCPSKPPHLFGRAYIHHPRRCRAAPTKTILLCEAAGFDRVIVETVGVGRSETLFGFDRCIPPLDAPGRRDELQGIKRGIMEMAGLLVCVNKDDGDNRPLARETASQYQQALRLFPPESASTPCRCNPSAPAKNEALNMSPTPLTD